MKIVRFLFVLLLIAVPAFAEQKREDLPLAPDPNTWLDDYWAKISPKIDFGVANMLMGWTEIITEPIDYYQAAPPKKCRFLHGVMGLGEGTLNAVVDTAGGILNLVTGLIPGKIPLPENGVDVARLTS